MKKYLKKIVILLIPFLLTSCVGNKQSLHVETQDTGNYPAPNQSNIPIYENNPTDMTYPSPITSEETLQNGQEIQFFIPTPTKDNSVITGILLTPDKNGTPYLAELILGNTVVADQLGYPPMISYSDDTNLRAKQNQNGQFYFENVPPGEYAILIATPLNAQLILDTKTNTPLLITAKGGKVTDLGIVVIP